ncbi:MAG TPA: lysophospholipid acyltransferase family protein [Polyangiaceae bacterium]|nr:lysophospholipid acyltransferase family protein [Polyangiaceae bacterium]
MDSKTALARIVDVAADDVIPFMQRLAAKTRRSADELALRVLGPDFEERFRILERRYEQMGGDPFGFDVEGSRHAAMLCAFFHRMYFRTEVYGVNNVPDGRVLLVSNHSGQVPIDGAIIGCSLLFDASPPRMIRAMVEKWAMTLPFVSTFFSRVGQVVGVPENARRLLEMGEILLVFPEGIRGISKPITRRYQLEEFGLGFMRLAIETKTPIIPVAVIGAEEQYVNLGNLRWAARALGMPVFPVVPQLALPGGVMPLPTKYRIYFGEPLHFDGDADDDDAVIEEKVWLVRQTIQSMVNRGIKARKGVFF